MRFLVLLLALVLCACAALRSDFPKDEAITAVAAASAFCNGEHEVFVGYLSKELQKTLGLDLIEERSLEMRTAYGEFQSIRTFTIDSTPDEQGAVLGDYTCSFDQGFVTIRVGIDAELKVVVFDTVHELKF